MFVYVKGSKKSLEERERDAARLLARAKSGKRASPHEPGLSAEAAAKSRYSDAGSDESRLSLGAFVRRVRYFSSNEWDLIKDCPKVHEDALAFLRAAEHILDDHFASFLRLLRNNAPQNAKKFLLEVALHLWKGDLEHLLRDANNIYKPPPPSTDPQTTSRPTVVGATSDPPLGISHEHISKTARVPIQQTQKTTSAAIAYSTTPSSGAGPRAKKRKVSLGQDIDPGGGRREPEPAAAALAAQSTVLSPSLSVDAPSDSLALPPTGTSWQNKHPPLSSGGVSILSLLQSAPGDQQQLEVSAEAGPGALGRPGWDMTAVGEQGRPRFNGDLCTSGPPSKRRKLAPRPLERPLADPTQPTSYLTSTTHPTLTANLADTPSYEHSASTTHRPASTGAHHTPRDPVDARSGCQSPPQATHPSAAHSLPIQALLSSNVDGGDGEPQTGGGPSSSTQSSESADDDFIASILAEHDCATELGQQAYLVALFGDSPLPIPIAFFELLKDLDGVPLHLPQFLAKPSRLHETLQKIGQIADGLSWMVDRRLSSPRPRWKAFRLMLLCVIVLREHTNFRSDGWPFLDLLDLLSEEVLQTVPPSFHETIVKAAAELVDGNAVRQICLCLKGDLRDHQVRLTHPQRRTD